jgi:hypothetical protein
MLKISQPIPQRQWHLGLCMQVDHGLLHGLKHLCLHSQHLLKSKWRGWRQVGVLVVVLLAVFSIVDGDTVPCVCNTRLFTTIKFCRISSALGCIFK